MAENSKIEWTDHTVNLWWGCSKVHTGCKNCYAEKLSERFGDNVWGEKMSRKRIKSWYKDLNLYQKQSKEKGVASKIFCGSMMDIFEDSKRLINPKGSYHFTEDLRDELFHLIDIGEYNNLIFLFLTKRPEKIGEWIPEAWHNKSPKNVWFGASISDQSTATSVIHELNYMENHNTFVSIEPQVDDIEYINLTNIDWVIQGGESGNNKRPFNIDWAYRMKQICKEQHTPFFFKQIDKIQEIPHDLIIREFPDFNI